MHLNPKLVLERIERVLDERITPAVYSARVPVALTAWEAPGEPVPFAEAVAAEFAPFSLGDSWGRAWSTWWFGIDGTIPPEWSGRIVELVIDPGFQGDWPGNQAEGLLYSHDGVPLKGIHPRNDYLRLAESATGGERIRLWMEAAANPDILAKGFRPTPYGDLATAPAEPIYRFAAASLAVFEPEVWGLRFDIEVLFQLAKELPEHDPRRTEVLLGIDRALDVLALDDIVGTAAAARAVLAPVLAKPANASAHTLVGIGHAHIDTAWLWPLRETRRKTGRTFSNVLALARQYPEFAFACSSAQQYAWVKQNYPTVWAGITQAIADGSWIPVGSQWVEPDGNLPGGEAMVRQLTQGIRFFRDELGVATKGVWLPDSFGYSAAFPQVAKLAGLTWFLTQKISWSQTNRFPHHTFWWEGIDGSRIFTHFPPIDTYNSTLEGEELHHAVREFRDKGGSTRSLVPFGYGDGGGGPTREMMERAARTADLEGSPRVTVQHPDVFFADAQAEYTDAPVWIGELYLELHRGTFTSHAREKWGNRRSEHLLREAELWSAAATLLTGADYPYEVLDDLWQRTLTQQFHDILPGSSIAWVHRENEAEYAAVHAALEALIATATTALAGPGMVASAAPHARRGLVDLDGTLTLVEVPGLAIAPATPVEAAHPVSVADADGAWTLDNGLTRVTVDARGLVTSVLDLRADRELVPAGAAANLLQLHEDLPNNWDAWDIDAHYRRSRRDLDEVTSIEVAESGPLRSTLRVTRAFGKSTAVQTITLDADDPTVRLGLDLDWQEDEKLLKAAVPLAVHAQHHSAEIPFGHLRRPINENTSWEDARFEVVAHRWIQVEEPGYGVAIANSGTYGHEVTHDVASDGEVVTTVRLSLVRAARVPDPDQDRGAHRFDYAIVPGAGIAEAVDAGYASNLPIRVTDGAAGDAPPLEVVRVSHPAVVVEAVKLADDRSGDLIVRLSESRGARASARVSVGLPVGVATEVGLLEDPIGDLPRARRFAADADGVDLELRAFQVVTLRFPQR
jgi:alpha-mannosidase